MDKEPEGRPWTVPVMVLLQVVVVVIGAVQGINLGDLERTALASLFAWGYWNGKQWAFTLTSVSAALILLIATMVIMFSVDVDTGIHSGVWSTTIQAGVWLALAVHPASKRFLRNEPHEDSTA